jgi:uncharacterized protein (DUF58 family)
VPAGSHPAAAAVYGLPTSGGQEPGVTSEGRTEDAMPTRQKEHMGGQSEGRKTDLPERIDLLHPRLLSEIGNLELVARQVLQGFLIGLHGSSRRGRSASFAENRLYNPGDDLRFVDWKVFGRSDRLYVKQFEEERNLRAYLVLDASASMAWRSDPERLPTKLDYAIILAACLGLLLLRQSDAAGLVTFDNRVREHVAPKALHSQGARMLRTLESVRGSGGSDAGGALRDIPTRLRRRGLAVLISDLLVDTDTTLKALRLLRHRGHEVLVCHVMDPGERELPAAGEAVYFDPESGEELRANSGALRRVYHRAVEGALTEWRLELARMGADYHLTPTDRPIGLVLREFLGRRARRP